MHYPKGSSAGPPPALSGRPIGQELPPRVYRRLRRERVARPLAVAFARKGYARTTVEDLRRAAGMAAGTFYALFGGKRECFDHVVEILLAGAEADLLAAVDSDAPWTAQARQAVTAILSWADAHPDEARVIFVESQSTPGGQDAYQGLMDRLADALSSGRSLLPTAAALPPSLELAMVSGVAHVLTTRLVERTPLGEPELAHELLGFLLDPYAGSAPAS